MIFSDSLQNLVSGLGTDRDKLAHTEFTSNVINLASLDAMYLSDWIAGTIIDAPCDDMIREWRSWKAGPRQLEAIENAEKALGVRQVLNKCLKTARLYGGSAMLIGTGDPRPDLPIVPERMKRGGIKYITSLSRWEIGCGEIDRDPMSPTYGDPTYYELHTNGNGMVQIHPSRVIRFHGIKQLGMQTSIDGWGVSVLQRVYDAVQQASSVCANIASLAYEAKVDIIKIPGLTQNVQNPMYQAALLTRLRLAQRGKSTTSALLLDACEEWEQKQLHFSGYPDLISKFLEIAAGAANMPVTRLLGKSPSGLNSTGEADLRHYYDTLHSRQEMELTPAMERFDQLLVRHATGAAPKRDIWYQWNPLWQMSQKELAAVGLTQAQTTQLYSLMGVMPPDALREASQAQLVDTGTYPGLEGILENHTGKKSEPLNPEAVAGATATAAARSAGTGRPAADAEVDDDEKT